MRGKATGLRTAGHALRIVFPHPSEQEGLYLLVASTALKAALGLEWMPMIVAAVVALIVTAIVMTIAGAILGALSFSAAAAIQVHQNNHKGI